MFDDVVTADLLPAMSCIEVAGLSKEELKNEIKKKLKIEKKKEKERDFHIRLNGFGNWLRSVKKGS